ncbi:MAG TPA: hypothetical protein VE871_11225 [Longimicrobium sp.]|nr:hypothetical protein [Longimicrobium sp.]
MRSTILLVAPLVLGLAAPAAAQDTIRPGQRVSGRITAADPALPGGSHYDVWRFSAQAHHRYVVTLLSDDFDASLVVGPDIQPGCDACSVDDDGGGGTNASLEYVGAEGGTYEIRAQSFDAEGLGSYDLILEDAGVHDEGKHAPAAAGMPITLGQAVQGELARGDAKDHGRSYSDTYSYQGRAGETLVITLDSDAFDAVLNFGWVNEGACVELNNDDDGGEGTNSRLVVTLREDGEHHVHVGSSDQGARGAYTLRMERATEPVAELEEEAEDAKWPIVAGRAIEGRLDDADPRADDDSFYEAWTYMGGVGETITIRMQSADFDTYLVVGRTVTGEWREMEANDDGPDGTNNSELTLTLPQNGEYVIRANAFAAGQTGRYTLRIDRN